MTRKNLLNRILQNTAHPNGFWGRMILRGMNRFHASMAEWAMRMVEWKEDWNVLDVGCGGGANIASLLDTCPQGKIHGIDISEASVAFARKHNKKNLGHRCFITQGNITSLPYDDEQFDAVTAFETIYFWPDLSVAFAEVNRVLRKGGLFLICCEASNPDNDKWTSRIDNMKVYSAPELKALLLDAGFTDAVLYQRPKENSCVIAYK